MAAKQPPNRAGGAPVLRGLARARKEKPVNKGGRPPKYQAAYAQQAKSLAMLGLTDIRLAAFFNVTEATIYRWRHDHPEFREALREGKEIVDAQVVSALFKRATGYSHEETDVKVVNGVVVQTVITKHHPPETGAATFWLTNRQPDTWKARREEVDPETGAPPPVRVEVAVVDARKSEGV